MLADSHAGARRARFQQARILQIQVPFYCDGNDDGYGDFRGILRRLPNIAADGYNVIWLSPCWDSPMLDGGFDPRRHDQVNPLMGTVELLEELCAEARKFGIEIMAEFISGHSSDQAPEFEASRNPNHPLFHIYEDHYHWTDDPNRWAAAPLMFPQQVPTNTTLDPVRAAAGHPKPYYYHVFYRFQPARNYRKRAVVQWAKDQIGWMYRVGIRIIRCDAVPHLWEEPGTDCHSLEQNYVLWKEIVSWAHEQFPDLVLLAEANDPLDRVLRYLTECGFDAVFDLDSNADIDDALGTRLAEPFLQAVEREASMRLPEHATRVRPFGLHDEVTHQMRARAQRHAAQRRFGRRFNWGIAARPMDFADGDLRAFQLIAMAIAILPGGWSVYQGNDLGLWSAPPEAVPPLPGQPVLDTRRRIRTLYPDDDGPGHGYSSTNPKRFPAPMVTAPFGSRAAQLRMPWSPHSITTGLNQLREEHPDLFCTGRLGIVRSDNRHVGSVTLKAPSAAGGEDVLLAPLNFSNGEQRVKLDLGQDYARWEARAIHPHLWGAPTSSPITVGDDGVLTLDMGAFDARYYLLNPRRRTIATA